MSRIIFSVVLIVALSLSACNKDEVADQAAGFDITKYESKLSTDYTGAARYHSDLSAAAISTGHFNNGMINPQYADQQYLSMYNLCDSLFSVHFYEFSRDLILNGGVAGPGYGQMMMGGQSGIMHSGPNTLLYDPARIAGYMDSLHTVNLTWMHSDYQFTDSLMYNQLYRCGVTGTRISTIEEIYRDMQDLRKQHRRIFNP